MVNGVKSQTAIIQYGVPQGSVLGPLFLIYINIINSSQLFSYSLFADDTSLLLSHKKHCYSIMAIANDEIKRLFAWYCCNKLLLNVQKTKCIIFRSRGKMIPNNVDLLNVGGHTVACSEHVQFLGVIVDEHLSWKPHLETMHQGFSKCRCHYVD